MSWSLTRERHAGSRRGGKAKAVIKTVSNGGQAARCPLIRSLLPVRSHGGSHCQCWVATKMELKQCKDKNRPVLEEQAQ